MNVNILLLVVLLWCATYTTWLPKENSVIGVNFHGGNAGSCPKCND